MSDDLVIPEGMSTLREPDVWVACDCGTACVFRRGLSLTQGWMWVWQPDCKHLRREAHEFVLMTTDGPLP